MGRGKKYQPEQIVNMLRQIEVFGCENAEPQLHMAVPRKE
jgi:hypothetical protein